MSNVVKNLLWLTYRQLPSPDFYKQKTESNKAETPKYDEYEGVQVGV